MPNIKEYNVKLRSLKNTQKITKTMKMVSASKLRRAHQAQANAKLYAQNLTALTSRLATAVDATHHPFFLPHEEVNRARILIITSDKGLCGSFNHNANKHVASWITENRQHHQEISISCCGRRGFMFFKKGEQIHTHYEGITENPQFRDAIQIGKDLSEAFINNEVDEVHLVYNQFFSPLSQKSVFEKILPIDPHALLDEKAKYPKDYIFEPEAKELLAFLIPHFLYFKIYFALLENSAGEHGARMSAMDNATKNAAELIEQYTVLRNRARQAAITTELTEIVAGAEALKG